MVERNEKGVVVMVYFVLVVRDYGSRCGYSGVSNGKRVVRCYESVDKVRELVKMSVECGNFVEFIGCGWRGKVSNGEIVWSRCRELERYGDDLDWSRCRL